MSKRDLSKKPEPKKREPVVALTTGTDEEPVLKYRAESACSVTKTTQHKGPSSNYLLKFLVCILPICLFFSYHPVISLGGDETMNFELSVPLIWLVMFDAVGAVMLIRRKMLFWGFRKWWMWGLLPVWLSLSVVWSLNVTRGVLTVGILWLVYFAVYVMWSLRELFDREFRGRFVRWFIGGTVVVCVWCMVQCVLDVAGVGREYTLMCEGCTYRMFGFPHPNGFAIEPQFMGNLLLAPAMTVAYIFLEKVISKKTELERSRGVVLTTGQADSARYFSTGSSSVPVVKATTGSRFLGSGFLLIAFFIISTTLFLTMSRGAIYAFVIGLVVMSVIVMVQIRRRMGLVLEEKVVKQERNDFKNAGGSGLKRVAAVWGVVVFAFVFALNLQGVMTEASPTDDTYFDGVARVINQLSLGVIDVRENRGVTEEQVESDSDETLRRNDSRGERGELTDEGTDSEGMKVLGEREIESGDREKAVFDGYVVGSTDARLRLSDAAFQVWSGDFRIALFGVGLGGAGRALYNNGLSPAPKEIVQNQYVSLLLETGIVGVILLGLTLVMAMRVIWQSPARGLLIGLVVAYGVTLLFFSGLPNALQIYLLPPVLLFMWEETSEEHQRGRRKKLVS